MPVESVLPVVSYSQMFQLPVHAGAPSIVDVLRRRALHREHDLLAVVRHLGVGRVAVALRELGGEVVLDRARRRLLAQHQVAAGGEGRAVGGIEADRVDAPGIGDRKVAGDGERVRCAGAAAAAAGEPPTPSRRAPIVPAQSQRIEDLLHRSLPDDFVLHGRAGAAGAKKPRGVVQRAGGVDDDRVDARKRLDQRQALGDAEHEDRLRQRLR